MPKIYEEKIKKQMIKLLKDEKQMNQFKFVNNDFLKELCDIFENAENQIKNGTSKTSNKKNPNVKIEQQSIYDLMDNKKETSNKIDLMDFNKIFNS